MTNILSIGIGASPNDTTGDPLRTAMSKVMTAVNGLAGNFNGLIAPAPQTPFQTWFDTSATPPTLRYYDGTQWVAAWTLNTSTHTFSLLAGAASANIGSLGGDLSGTLPNPTITKIQGTAVTGTTGSGNAVLSMSPSITGQLSIASSGNNPTIIATDTGTAPSFTTPPYNFLSTEPYGSFSSASTHFGFVIQCTKAAPSANTTGSRQAFTCQQLGAGGTAVDYFTAGFQLCKPTAGSFANAGNFSANNPYVYIPSGMAPTSVVGEEIDVTTLSNVTNIREGLRIVDIGSTGSPGVGIDAGIGISSSGIGFVNGIFFGDSGGGLFPIPAGGNLINTVPSTVALNAGISLLGLTGTYTYAPILLAAGNKGIWWGATKAGGSVVSETTANGPDIILGNSAVGFRFAGVTSVFALPYSFQCVPVTIANLPASPVRGQVAFIHDTVGNAVPAYHVIVAGGGSTTVDGMAYYDGAAWRWV